MKWTSRRSVLNGEIEIPASKSHTIRALLIATLAEGQSRIQKALLTGDGESSLKATAALGAKYSMDGETLVIEGCGTNLNLSDFVDMGNSGTGSKFFTAAAALGDKPIKFDGDASLRSRPMLPLMKALEEMGASVEWDAEVGCLPYTVCGPVKSASVEVDGKSSQYLSSLLLIAPLLQGTTKIYVPKLFEKPYAEMTLWWLDKMGISYSSDSELSNFTVEGGQSYSTIDEVIAGDFSSATFAAVGAVVTGGEVLINNIDFSDPQGDKEVFTILEKMGAKVVRGDKCARVSAPNGLRGIEIDLNDMPDSLPAFSVLGTVAEGETRLVNVAQARIKETDRIAVMAKELSRMGADIEERPDGLVIRKSALKGAEVCGHDDHRIAMSLTLAGFIADGDTLIDTVECAAVTYPTFREDFISLGGEVIL